MARKKSKERVFSAHEVAMICGVVNQTAINWIDKGHLEAFSTPGGQYRVYADVLAKFLQRQGMRLPEELKQALAEQMRIDRVLIIDHDKESSDHVCGYLVRRYPEYRVIQAFSGYEAGRAVLEHAPDLVILDMELPGVDGLKMCRQIRAEERLARPVIIAISRNGSGPPESAVLEAGADVLLTGPVSPESLPALIKELAETRATRRDQ